MKFAIAHDVMADVTFQNLEHKTVHRSAKRRQNMQNVAAILSLVDSPMQSIKLSLQPPDAGQEAGLVFLSVCHGGVNVAENRIGGKGIFRIGREKYPVHMGAVRLQMGAHLLLVPICLIKARARPSIRRITPMKKTISALAGLAMLAAATPSIAAEPAAKPAAAPESCQIRNKKFGKLLRPEDASGADGARIVLYPAQSWKCMTWKMHPAGEATFYLQNHFTGKTFAPAATDDGTQAPVTQVPFTKNAQERPVWRLTKLPDGLYQIIENKSGKALTATPADSGGARITIAPAGKGDEQKWEVEKIDPAKLTM